MARNSVNLALGFDITVKTELMTVLKTSRAVEAVVTLPTDQLVVLSRQFAQELMKATGIRELELDPTILPTAVVENTGYFRTELGIELHQLPTTPRVQEARVYPEPLRQAISVEQALRFRDRTDPVTLLIYVSRFHRDLRQPVFTVWEDERKNPCIIYVYPDWDGHLARLVLATHRFSRGQPGFRQNLLVSFKEISPGWQLLQFC